MYLVIDRSRAKTGGDSAFGPIRGFDSGTETLGSFARALRIRFRQNGNKFFATVAGQKICVAGCS